MEKLQALYEQIVNLQDISSDDKTGMREYRLEQGSAFAITLKSNAEVAVTQSFLSKDTIFPLHKHDDAEEVLIVYSGSVTIVTDYERRLMKPGDSIHLCKGCSHMLHAHTDCKIIAVTIPPDFAAIPRMREDGR